MITAPRRGEPTNLSLPAEIKNALGAVRRARFQAILCASPCPGRRAPTRAGETEARGRNSARLAPAGARLPEDSFLSFAGDPAKVRTERPT
jgi:hypothetical protein